MSLWTTHWDYHHCQCERPKAPGYRDQNHFFHHGSTTHREVSPTHLCKAQPQPSWTKKASEDLGATLDSDSLGNSHRWNEGASKGTSSQDLQLRKNYTKQDNIKVKWRRIAVGSCWSQSHTKDRYLNLTKTQRTRNCLLTASQAGKRKDDYFVSLEDQGMCQDSAFMPLPMWSGWVLANLLIPHSLVS